MGWSWFASLVVLQSHLAAAESAREAQETIVST